MLQLRSVEQAAAFRALSSGCGALEGIGAGGACPEPGLFDARHEPPLQDVRGRYDREGHSPEYQDGPLEGRELESECARQDRRPTGRNREHVVHPEPAYGPGHSGRAGQASIKLRPDVVDIERPATTAAVPDPRGASQVSPASKARSVSGPFQPPLKPRAREEVSPKA